MGLALTSISAQAMEHALGLLLILLTIYAAYWVLGIARWPIASRSGALLERWGTVDLGFPGAHQPSSIPR
jgi:hypothetical protein